MQRQRLRLLIETGLGALSACLLVLALIAPHWIERLLAVAPDGGDGSTEWAILLLCATTLVLFLKAGHTWRRAASA